MLARAAGSAGTDGATEARRAAVTHAAWRQHGTLPEPVAPRRFEIVRCLGHGGMGVVYEAIDRERGVRVALKRLRDAEPEGVARFEREFRCLAGRRHPGWVQTHELIEEDGRWFITMELVDGVDFLTWVRAAGAERPFDEPRLRDALRQLCAALAALHACGKVHRDVKSANVLVTPAGRVVLLDFGLVADLYEDPSLAGECFGTPAYVAPEQAAGAPPDPAADWYSVGVLLYHAITGALPFTGSAAHVLVRKASKDPPRPRECVAAVPDDLERLCMALLARDPTARPGGRELLALVAPRGPARHSTPRPRPRVRLRSWALLCALFAMTADGAPARVSLDGRTPAAASQLEEHDIRGTRPCAQPARIAHPR